MEVTEQYEIEKIYQNLNQRVWAYGIMSQTKVPCWIEDLSDLTDQRKQTKLRFFRIWAKWLETIWNM
jgi:hypothetical protein